MQRTTAELNSESRSIISQADSHAGLLASGTTGESSEPPLTSQALPAVSVSPTHTEEPPSEQPTGDGVAPQPSASNRREALNSGAGAASPPSVVDATAEAAQAIQHAQRAQQKGAVPIAPRPEWYEQHQQWLLYNHQLQQSQMHPGQRLQYLQWPLATPQGQVVPVVQGQPFTASYLPAPQQQQPHQQQQLGPEGYTALPLAQMPLSLPPSVPNVGNGQGFAGTPPRKENATGTPIPAGSSSPPLFSARHCNA